ATSRQVGGLMTQNPGKCDPYSLESWGIPPYFLFQPARIGAKCRSFPPAEVPIMPREPRFDPLFQPLAIGPVTAPNRFYQVPHCTGMGFAMPETLAAMRAVKAEGGW